MSLKIAQVVYVVMISFVMFLRKRSQYPEHRIFMA